MTSNLPAFPEIPASPESRLRWLAWGEQIARMERERWLPLLTHAVREADGWHDEARGGPILRDPLMDAARDAIRKEPLFNLVADESLPDDVLEVRDSRTGAVLARTKFTKEPQ